MSRFALLIASLALPAALFVGCAEECANPDECAADEVCYKSTCRSALHEELNCVTDEDCGPPPASGARPFICVTGRCGLSNNGAVVSMDAGTSSTADAGP